MSSISIFEAGLAWVRVLVGVYLFPSSAVWQQRASDGCDPALESCRGLRRLPGPQTELPRVRRVGPASSSCAGTPQGRRWLPLSNRVAVVALCSAEMKRAAVERQANARQNR